MDYDIASRAVSAGGPRGTDTVSRATEPFA
jgi:hypothetical protein